MIETNFSPQTLLSCGNAGDTALDKKCYYLDARNNRWSHHSDFQLDLNEVLGPKAVTMPEGLYILGRNTSQFLPRGANEWKEGPGLAPGASFLGSCVVRVSPQEFVVMGGHGRRSWEDPDRSSDVWKYNTADAEWKRMTGLRKGRHGHACVLYPNPESPYIIVSGGIHTYDPRMEPQFMKTTELYFLNGQTSVTNHCTGPTRE